VCDRVVYASALADLAALARTTAGQRFALAATDGSLLGRVRRILGGAEDSREGKLGWWPALLAALTIAGLAPIALSSAPAARTPAVKVMSFEAPRGESATPQTNAAAPAPNRNQAEPRSEPARRAASDGGEQQPDRDQIEKLRAMVARIEGDLAQIGDPEQSQKLIALRDQLLAAADRLREAQALRERFGEESTTDDEQVRKVRAKLAAAARQLRDGPEGSLAADAEQLLRDGALDRADELKARLAQLDAIKAELAIRDEQALGAQSDEMRAERAQMEAETIAAYKAKLDEEQTQAAGDVETREAKITAKRRQDAERLAAMVADERGTAVDAKRVLSFIGPALKAGPGEISVVGDVKHPGPITWEAGLTAAAALAHAGGPSADNADIQIGRLSEMNLTWSADGPDSRLRMDVVEPSAILRAGDVIVVTATKRK